MPHSIPKPTTTSSPELSAMATGPAPVVLNSSGAKGRPQGIGMLPFNLLAFNLHPRVQLAACRQHSTQLLSSIAASARAAAAEETLAALLWGP